MFRIANLSTFDSLQNAHNKSIGYSGKSFAVSNAPKSKKEKTDSDNGETDEATRLGDKWGDFYSEDTVPNLEFFGFKKEDFTDEEWSDLSEAVKQPGISQSKLGSLPNKYKTKEENLEELKNRIETAKKASSTGVLKKVFNPTSDKMGDGLWESQEDRSIFYPSNYTAPQNLFKSGQHRYQTIPKVSYEDAFETVDMQGKKLEEVVVGKEFGNTHKLKSANQRPKCLSCYTDDGSVYVELVPGSGDYKLVGVYGEIIDIPNPYDSSKKYQIVADDDGEVRSRLVANGRSRAVTHNDADTIYGVDKGGTNPLTLKEELIKLSARTAPQRTAIIRALGEALTTGDDVYILLKETDVKRKLKNGDVKTTTYLKKSPDNFQITTEKPTRKNTPYILLPNEEIRANYEYLLSALSQPIVTTQEDEDEDDKYNNDEADFGGVIEPSTYRRLFSQGILDKIKHISPETKAVLLGNLISKENSLLSKIREENNEVYEYSFGFGIDEQSGDVEIVKTDEQSDFDFFIPYTLYEDNKSSITRFLSVVPKDELQKYLTSFKRTVGKMNTKQQRNAEAGIAKVVLSPKPVPGLESNTRGDVRISDGGDIADGWTFVPFAVISGYLDDFMDMFSDSGMSADTLSNVEALKFRSPMLKEVIDGDIIESDLPIGDRERLTDTAGQVDGIFSGLSKQEILDKLSEKTMTDGRVLSNPLALFTRMNTSNDINKVTALLMESISELQDKTGNNYSYLVDYLEKGGDGKNFTQEAYRQLMSVLSSDTLKQKAQKLVGMTKVVQDLDDLAKIYYEDGVEGMSAYLKKQGNASGGQTESYYQSVLRGAESKQRKREAEKLKKQSKRQSK